MKSKIDKNGAVAEAEAAAAERPARRRKPKNHVRAALHALRALIEQADASGAPAEARERAQLVLQGLCDALEGLEAAIGGPVAQEPKVYQALVEHGLREEPQPARLFGGGA